MYILQDYHMICTYVHECDMYSLRSFLAICIRCDAQSHSLQISNTVQSVFIGPMFGMFLLAGSFPFVGPEVK